MDLISLKPSERMISILHPGDGTEMGITVTVMSIQDERMKVIKRNFMNERIRLEQRGKAMKADDLLENSHKMIASAMTGWDWGEHQFDGARPAFNKATIIKVFETLPWFHKQIDDAINDESAFFPTSEVDSKKPSASTSATK